MSAKLVYRIELFLLLDKERRFISPHNTYEEALKAANDLNGGYEDHIREIFVDTEDEQLDLIPARRNYHGDRSPAYFIQRVNHYLDVK